MADSRHITRRSALVGLAASVATAPAVAAPIATEDPSLKIGRLCEELSIAMQDFFGNQFAALVMPEQGQYWFQDASAASTRQAIITACHRLKSWQEAENEACAAYKAGPKIPVWDNPLHEAYWHTSLKKNDALTDLLGLIWRDL